MGIFLEFTTVPVYGMEYAISESSRICSSFATMGFSDFLCSAQIIPRPIVVTRTESFDTVPRASYSVPNNIVIRKKLLLRECAKSITAECQPIKIGLNQLACTSYSGCIVCAREMPIVREYLYYTRTT